MINYETLGQGEPIVGIVACVHGDEPAGLATLRAVKEQKILKGTVKCIVANRQALAKNTRFIDTDLNRAFPGKEDSALLENRLAYKLKGIINDCDYVLDLHSFPTETPPFAFCTYNRDVSDFAAMTGIQKLVYLGHESTRTLISNCRKGLILELGQNVADITKSAGVSAIFNFLGSLGMITAPKRLFSPTELEVYEIFDSAQKPTTSFTHFMKNFELVRQGQQIINTAQGPIVAKYDFYPIVIDNKYSNTVYRAARLKL